MLTRRGATLLGGGAVVYALGLLTGYDHLLVLGAGAVVAVVVGSLWIVRRGGFDVDRSIDPDRIVRGQEDLDGRSAAQARLTVVNRGRLRSPEAVAVERVDGAPLTVAVPRLTRGEVADLAYELPNDRRGVFAVGPVEVTRQDPLALWRTVQRGGGVQQLWVHPRSHALVLLAGSSPSLDGDQGAKVFEGSVTFDALREYVRGDDLRRVHWPSYARTGNLLVRESVDTGIPRTTILVDTRSEAFGSDSDRPGGSDDGFEAAMELAASVAEAAAAAGHVARLVTTCGRSVEMQEAGRRPTAILDCLASLDRAPGGEIRSHLAALAVERGADVLTAVTGLAPTDDLTAIGVAARRYRHSVLVVAGTGAADHRVPAGVADRVVRGTTGEELAHRWNLGVT